MFYWFPSFEWFLLLIFSFFSHFLFFSLHIFNRFTKIWMALSNMLINCLCIFYFVCFLHVSNSRWYFLFKCPANNNGGTDSTQFKFNLIFFRIAQLLCGCYQSVWKTKPYKATRMNRNNDFSKSKSIVDFPLFALIKTKLQSEWIENIKKTSCKNNHNLLNKYRFVFFRLMISVLKWSFKLAKNVKPCYKYFLHFCSFIWSVYWFIVHWNI